MTVFEAAKAVSAVEAGKKLGLSMKRTGSRYAARCIFHEDRTPSLVLYPQKGGFHCFGCGAHGDSVTLYQQALGVGAYEAAMRLCDDFGLKWEKGRAKAAFRPRKPDPRVLMQKLVHFREGRAAGLVERRTQAQLRMAQREAELNRDKIPFDEWWDDPVWAAAMEESAHAEEELQQLDAMDPAQLWQLWQKTKEEMNDQRLGNP